MLSYIDTTANEGYLIESGRERTLPKLDDGTWFAPCSWSPDGRLLAGGRGLLAAGTRPR